MEEPEPPLLRLFLSGAALFVPRLMLTEAAWGSLIGSVWDQRAMRLPASELLNGVIFAALVVLASEMQRFPSRPSEALGQATEPVSLQDVRTHNFAPSSLARSSLASSLADDGAEFPTVGEANPVPRAAENARDVSGAGAGSALPRQAAIPAERMNTAPAAPEIDAFVPPVRRQRPITPPLTFAEPSPAKKNKLTKRKAAKTEVRRAAHKKPEPARSALGGATREAAASKSKP